MNVLFSKNRSSIVVGTFISAMALLSSLPAHSESLKVIYQQAVANDHEYLAAKAELGAGLEQKNLGRVGIMPNVSAEAARSQTEFTNNLLNETDQTGTTTYKLEVQQSIFNASAWHTYRRGKLLANAATLKFESEEQGLIIRTAEAYLGALKSADQANTAKAEQNALSHQLEQTKQRFEVGLTAITEVHEAQAAFDSSTASKLLADGGLGIAFETLEALTGHSYQSLHPLKKEFSAKPPKPAIREEWVKLALKNNTNVKATKIKAEADKADAKAKKSAHLPTLAGSIRYTGTDEELNSGDNTKDNTVASIAISLNIPLYDGGFTSASRRQTAREQLKSQELHLRAKRLATLDARSSYLTVLTSAATVKAREQAITSNHSALEATQAGYDVGTRDLVDVLNSQRFLYRAERDYYDALYDYIIATLKLKQAAGILTAEDLYELDQSLDTKRLVKYNG